MSDSGESRRFQLVVPDGVLNMVRRLAQKERRSISNMIVVLLEEALQAREKEEKGQLAAASTARVSYSY